MPGSRPPTFRARFLARAILLAGLAAVGGSARPVLALPWTATGAESLNVTILGAWQLPQGGAVWDCAAYVDPQGREYALLASDSLYVIDLADPRHPRRVAAIPTLSLTVENAFRDVAVYGRYAYAAARHGPIRIVDLWDPAHAMQVGEIPREEFCACSCGHPCSDPARAEIETVFIDERGVLFVTGIDCGEGVLMYDLAPDPVHPRWLCQEHTRPPEGGSFYTHDVYVRNGIIYASRSRGQGTVGPRWDILDGTRLCPSDPGACGDGSVPALLGSFRHGEADLHSHSAWPLDDPRYLLTCDEITDGHVRIWDVSNPAAAVQLSEIRPDNTCHSVHNAYVRGSLAFITWWNKGIQVYDVGNPRYPERVGWYEHPSRWNDAPGAHCCDPIEGPGGSCTGIPFLDPFFPSGIFVASEGLGNLLVGAYRPQAVGTGEDRSARTGRISTSGSLRDGLRILWAPRPEDLAALGGPRSAPDLTVYSTIGVAVARLHAARGDWPRSAVYEWDGRDRLGRIVPHGVYQVGAGGVGGAVRVGKIIVAE